MKIKSVRLERYKRFVDRTFDFIDEDTGKPYDLIVLVGENGCGKSSILQAIAATLGTATEQIGAVDFLDFPGFNYSSIDANHQGKSEITLEVSFTEDELLATTEYYEKNGFKQTEGDIVVNGTTLSGSKEFYNVTQRFFHLINPPSHQNEVELRLLNDSNRGEGLSNYTVNPTTGNLNQFRGRTYALELENKIGTDISLQNVGSIFWYDENRNSSSLTPYEYDEISQKLKPKDRNVVDSVIRNMIASWFAEENQPKITKFREIYKKLFPDRTLSRIAGISSTRSVPKIYFKHLITGYEYDISEVSGGERAILPIILDFVRWDINNSVILIDELELHLHPPLQRALIYNLQNLGNNNQFIITTHSDYVANMVRAIPRSKLIRVDNV